MLDLRLVIEVWCALLYYNLILCKIIDRILIYLLRKLGECCDIDV